MEQIFTDERLDQDTQSQGEQYSHPVFSSYCFHHWPTWPTLKAWSGPTEGWGLIWSPPCVLSSVPGDMLGVRRACIWPHCTLPHATNHHRLPNHHLYMYLCMIYNYECMCDKHILYIYLCVWVKFIRRNLTSLTHRYIRVVWPLKR